MFFHIFRNCLFFTLRKVLKYYESMDGWDIMVRMIFPFSRPFPQLDFSMHSGRPLAHFGHPWVSKWLTFGSPWLPFGSLWQPFGSLLVPFGFLWLTFGTLFEEIMKTFINAIRFHEFSRLVNNVYDLFVFFATQLRRKYPAT